MSLLGFRNSSLGICSSEASRWGGPGSAMFRIAAALPKITSKRHTYPFFNAFVYSTLCNLE